MELKEVIRKLLEYFGLFIGKNRKGDKSYPIITYSRFEKNGNDILICCQINIPGIGIRTVNIELNTEDDNGYFRVKERFPNGSSVYVINLENYKNFDVSDCAVLCYATQRIKSIQSKKGVS